MLFKFCCMQFSYSEKYFAMCTINILLFLIIVLTNAEMTNL